MSEQVSKVWVCGIYCWNVSTTKEQRQSNRQYPRHNWADIDTKEPIAINSVLEVFKKYKVSCLQHETGKGHHVFGDLVPYETWRAIWGEIKQYCDPNWPPHTLRISRKYDNENWCEPVWHNFGNYEIRPNWVKALNWFLVKESRHENNQWLKKAMERCGLQKYWHCTLYLAEVKN